MKVAPLARGLVEVSIDPLIALTAAGRITYINEAAVRFFGVPRAKLIGVDFTEFFAKPDLVRAVYREVLSKGSVAGCCLVVRNRMGQTIDVVFNASTYPISRDEVEILISLRDVGVQKRAEHVARQTQQRFAEAQRLAHIGYWEQYLDAGGAFWSEEACRILGLPVREHSVTLGQLTDRIHPDDRGKAMRAIRQALRGGPRYDMEFRVVRPDGEERVVHCKSDLSVDSTGHPLRVFGTIQDITERKRIEEELRLSNTRRAEILESITDRFAVLDRNWRYVYVNDRQAWSRSLSREEMMGRCFWDIYPELVGTVAEEKLKQAMKERVPVSYEVFLPSQNCWLGVHAYPSKEGVSTYSRDITESKQANERLRYSEARFRALYRDNPSMLFTLDPQCTVLAVNPAGVNQLGYALSELKGASVLNVFHPDDRAEVSRQLEACLRNPDLVQHWQFRKVRKDGSILWVDELAQPIRDINGDLNMLLVCQDITDRKQVEEEARTLHTLLEQRVQDRTRELAESEKRFRHIFDTAPVSIWQEDWTEVGRLVDEVSAQGITDWETYFTEHPEFVESALKSVKVLDVNQWTLDMLGASTKEQLIASLSSVFATPETIRSFIVHLTAFANGHTTYRSEGALNTLKGGTLLCFIAMTFPPPESGEGKVLATVIDISEHKRTEEALRRSEENSRLLFDTTLQGVVFQDTEGQVISMNPAAIRILGKTPEETRNGWLDLDHHMLREDGSPLPENEHPARVALATGHEVRIMVVGIFNPKEQAYRWINVRAVPLFRDGADKPHQVYTIFDDITERRSSEQHIRWQTALLTGINRIFRETLPHVTDDEVSAIFLHAICDLTASSIGFADETHAPGNWPRITLDRSLQAQGDLSREDVLALLHHPESVSLKEAFVIGRSQIMNRPPSDHPAMRAITRFLGVPLLENGKVIGIIGLANKATDYTDDDRMAVEVIAPAFVEVLKRKRSEHAVLELNDQLAGRALALERANKELESFSYSASHDLRAPLRSLEGFSRALVEDYEDRLDEVGKDYLHRIRKASGRMSRLIDDMLHLAQVSRSELHRTPVNLSAVAHAVADAIHQADPDRKIEFVIEPNLIASGDAHLLQIVIENLFGNACKFSSSRPVARIEFGQTMREGALTYFVRDNGVGFDMRFAHKLFGAFQRLHSPAEFPGTGIGLATVQRVIHRHGGSVAAEGKPCEGATFYFTLPTQSPAA